MILIAGFPYIREAYFDTFRHYPEPNQLIFLLPKVWKIKDGKIIFYPPKDSRVNTSRAFFFHSHYPIIGGLLKGWMPWFPLILWRKRKEISLVYSCSEPNLLTTLYYGFWSKLLGKKHILFSWENIPYWEKFGRTNWMIKKIIIKLNLFLSDGIICGNKKGEEIFKQLTHKPIAVIPMSGVDAELFKPKEHLRVFNGYDWSDKVIFTFAGAIGYRKGIHNIIESFRTVIESVPKARLVIAGTGEYELEIEEAMRKYDLVDYVTRFSWIKHDDLPKLFDASDVFLYPSIPSGGWEEQFGYSIAEASLMELPIITTNSGSITDLVINEKTGLIVEPGDAMALANAMIRLADDRNLRLEFGKNGREYIEKHFAYKKVAQDFYDFFSSLLFGENK